MYETLFWKIFKNHQKSVKRARNQITSGKIENFEMEKNLKSQIYSCSWFNAVCYSAFVKVLLQVF